MIPSLPLAVTLLPHLAKQLFRIYYTRYIYHTIHNITMQEITKRTKQFQCAYHPDFQTNSIDDFKTHLHLHLHQKISKSNIDKKIPEVNNESGLINKDLLLN